MKKNDSRILAVIPARGGSKGVPGKNIRELSGKPLIIHTLDAAEKSGCFEEIYVSTDSKPIQKIVVDYGFHCDELRPAELAEDDTPMQPVVLHALTQSETKNTDRFDLVCLLQPTSPFRGSNHIRQAILAFYENDCDTLVSVMGVPHRFIPSSLMVENANYLYHFDNDQFSQTRHDDPVLWARNGPAILITKADVVREGNLYGGKVAKFEMDFVSSVDIDDEEDWNLAVLLARFFEEENSD